MLNQQNQSNFTSKQIFRQYTWDYMMKNDLVNFPSHVYKRIPNFKGADEAAKRLSMLDEFKNAKVIKINSDKPQEPVRLLALETQKEILVPIPRLKSGLFLHVASPDVEKHNLKVVATRHGLQEYGKPLGVDFKIKVDLVVLGAVCVSHDGYRIGKGEGFADLEYAMMMRMGAVNDNTIVVTTVHDSQIIDNLEKDLFQKHDVPVDIIVTPTQTIIIDKKLKKPVGIFWDILTPKRIKSIHILHQLKLMDEREGKDTTLRNDDLPRYGKSYAKRSRNKKNINLKSSESITKADDELKDEIKEKSDMKRRISRKRYPRKQQTPQKETTDENLSTIKTNENVNQKPREKLTRRKSTGYRSKAHIDFSLKLSNISQDVRVKDLKNALAERGVRPSDITWRGQRGFCYIHFSKLRNKDSEPNEPIQVDSIVANLQQLQIGNANNTENKDNNFIVVELDKPITRIEITDVTVV